MRHFDLKALLIVGLFALLSAKLHAQVTIGSGEKPIEGALLDLKQETKSDGSANSNKGLGLPRVALEAIDKLEPCTETNTDSSLQHRGLTVYNTTDNSSTIGTLKEGVYLWDGDTWQPMGLRGAQGFGPWYQVNNPDLPSRLKDTDSYLEAKAVVGGTTIMDGAALSVYGGAVIDGKTTVKGTDALTVETPLKITSGDPGADKILKSDATGTAAWVDPNALSGTFFYLPPFDLDITTVGNKQVDLYTDVYKKQFTRTDNTNFVSSGDNLLPTVAAILEANKLDFVVTDYTDSVIKINSISAEGIMDYEVLTINGAGAYVNIILRVK